MKVSYLIKEFNYFRKLDGLNRVFKKFLLSYTPLSGLVNTPIYNHFYGKIVAKKTKKMLPTFLQVENTNLCNAKCIMCPHGKMKRKTGIMTLEQFKKIVDNVIPYYPIKRFALNGFGEPFIDKGIAEKILYLNEKYPSVKVEIYSNASLLDEEMINKLTSCRINKINFSINGTSSSYKKIMGLNYDNTLKNVINFIEKTKKIKNRPLVNVSLVLTEENKNDAKEFANFWEKKADSVIVYLPFNWAGEVKDLGFSKNQLIQNKRWPCYILWSSVIVDVNGNVIMCCADYESKVKFGNLLKNNIKDIRASEKFRKVLDSQLQFKFNTPICATCDNAYDSSMFWITE